MPPSRLLLPLLLGVALVMFARAPFMIADAPLESTMGLVQKIFYFHVPAAIVSLLAAMVCGVAGVVYLVRRRPGADQVAIAAAELAVVFGVIMLITGPLWARKAWGVWWQWDARLTTALVMWMVMVAYLLLRRFGGPGSEIMAAATGVFAMVLVPFVYWSVNIWRTLHPKTSVAFTLPPEMAAPFWWCVAAFGVLFTALVMLRARIEAARLALDDTLMALEDRR
jgi:heme exporter protein C